VPDRPARPGPAGGREPKGANDGPGEFVAKAIKAALPVIGRGAFPGLLLFIVLPFMAIQNRIDRNDPKLALAPINDEPYVYFNPNGPGRPRP
jgi:hypothetical protein